jgi:hypothetical protein
VDEEGFGQYNGTVEGDDRTSFIQPSKGHAFHLLYLWYMIEKHQIISEVLCIIDTAVSADGCNQVPRDTQAVNHNKQKADEEIIERKKKNRFRDSLGCSMRSIAVTTKKVDCARTKRDSMNPTWHSWMLRTTGTRRRSSTGSIW